MNGYSGCTGKLLEDEVLGQCLWLGSGSYVSYRESMDMVKRFQPWDPTDPSSVAANNLHSLVAEALGIEDYSGLKLYTAVGSPLDWFHGVDGFVEWNGIVVTIDLTMNERKNGPKADIILYEEDVYTEDGQVNEDGLWEVARETARLLLLLKGR